MALNIKDPETDRLVRELAEQTGSTITDAIKTAVAHELAKTRPDFTAEEIEKRRKGLQEIIERARARAHEIDYSLSEDEILGYDEHGVPS